MTEDIQGAAASASEPALALRAKPQERLDAARFDQAQGILTAVVDWYSALPGSARKGLSLHHLHTLSKQLRNFSSCERQGVQELVHAVREECAKVCDRHINVPLCRRLFGDQRRGAFGMASHLATDVRSASFHDSKRVNQAIAALAKARGETA